MDEKYVEKFEVLNYEPEHSELVNQELKVYNEDSLSGTINSIRNMSYEELYDFLVKKYDWILNILYTRDIKNMSKLYNAKFLEAFTDFLNNNQIDYDKYAINDFLKIYIKKGDNNEEINENIAELSEVINYDIVFRLLNDGIGYYASTYIAIYYNSYYPTYDDKIMMFNYIIAKLYSRDNFSEDPIRDIVKIYQFLFSKIGRVFNITMTNYYKDISCNDKYMDGVSCIIESLIVLAESMPKKNIESLLIQYYEYIKDNNLRSIIDMNDIPKKYNRFNDVLRDLQNTVSLY